MKLEPEFISIDRHFGKLMSRLSTTASQEIRWASELVSMATRNGHGCIYLEDWVGKEILWADGVTGCLPSLEKFRDIIISSGVSSAGEFPATPLVCENDRLYLRRYWEYENQVRDFILRAVLKDESFEDLSGYVESLQRYFPEETNKFSWHRLAAITSLVNTFVVLTGGPGTGKTTNVARIMALWVEGPGKENLRIALAAPTGKAVMRLQDSIRKSLEYLKLPVEIRDKIPTRAETIHRLLGTIKDSPYFRYNEQNRLPYDLVVVDEASMIDLPLMAKLVSALSDNCCLILLGDRNQLSSVEPGSVLGDISLESALNSFSPDFISVAGNFVKSEILTATENDNSLADSLVELRENFRFSEKSGIGKLVEAIKKGYSENAMRIALSDDYPDVVWREIGSSATLEKNIKPHIQQGEKYNLARRTPEEMLAIMAKSQLLCVLRKGPYGVISLNNLIQERFVSRSKMRRKVYFEGLPVMITQNDYQLNLYNGDTGVIAKDPDDSRNLKAFFAGSGGAIRSFSFSMLPTHEAVYAMTVHKSQGSEFDEVILILPDTYSQVLTRELIYTAVSRARNKIEIWGGEEIFRAALDSKTSRRGGLADKLWGSNNSY